MIPIFLWSSLCAAVGLLQIIFPNLFPSAANYALTGAYNLGTTVNNARRLTRIILTTLVAMLAIWGILLGFAIYTKRWEWAVAGLVSTGLAFLATSILMLMAKSIVTAGLAHINTWATAWSAGIPLQTVPWHALPTPMKLTSLMLSPLYGLYLLLVLPAKGVLEAVKAVASFGPTLGNWMQRLITIMSAVSVCSFFLTTLAAFQLQFPVIQILDITTLGLSLLFIAMLIALMLMSNNPMINVVEFIQNLGYIALFMIPLIGVGHLMPALAANLQKNLENHWGSMVTNTATYDWVAMLVTLSLFAGIAFMPWARKFAGVLSMGLLVVWTLSTNPATPFYTKWEWWVATVGLFVGWMILRQWQNPTPATPAAPGTAATPAAFPWGWVFGLAVVAAIVVIVWITTNHSATAAPANVVVASVPYVPPPLPVPAGPLVAYSSIAPPASAPIQATSVDANWASKVHVNTSDPLHNAEQENAFGLARLAPNQFGYQLDGRVRLVDQYAVDEYGAHLTAYPGDTVIIDSDPDSQICEHNDPCAGPLGQTHGHRPADYNQTEWSAYNLAEYPVRDAVIGQLCAIIGQVRIPVGFHTTYTVPQGVGVVDIRLGANIRDRFAPLAKAGHRVAVTRISSR